MGSRLAPRIAFLKMGRTRRECLPEHGPAQRETAPLTVGAGFTEAAADLKGDLREILMGAVHAVPELECGDAPHNSYLSLIHTSRDFGLARLHYG